MTNRRQDYRIDRRALVSLVVGATAWPLAGRAQQKAMPVIGYLSDWLAMYPYRDYVEAGGLMAYAVDLGKLGRRMADDVHQILDGAKPGDIPIYRPTKYQLLVNLKAAKALGLTIPPVLLGTADEVIE